VQPPHLVSLTQPAAVTLGPAQASSLTVTVRMPSTEAMQRPGEIIPIRFHVVTLNAPSQTQANEASTFLVPQ
jgi:hypothetical protein